MAIPLAKATVSEKDTAFTKPDSRQAAIAFLQRLAAAERRDDESRTTSPESQKQTGSLDSQRLEPPAASSRLDPPTTSSRPSSSSRGAKSRNSAPLASNSKAVGAATTATTRPRSTNAALASLGVRVVGPIAAGAFSTIIRARHLASGVEYAVKTFEKAKCVEAAQVEARDRELYILRLISTAGHPNIANLIDDEESAVGWHAYLHYCGKGSLMSHLVKLRKKQMLMDSDEAALLIGQISSALEHIHSLGVSHRDVKPANVLYDGQAWRLCDFGFATQSTERERLKHKLGTLSYCAPEILSGAGYVGACVDMWALGCVLYEVRVGRPCFVGENEETMTLRIKNGFKGGSESFPWLAHMKREKGLISALLSKVADDRPTAKQVQAHKWLMTNLSKVKNSAGQSTTARRASRPQWWCDVGTGHCLRPTQPENEHDVCYVHPNGQYVCCEACYRTGRALNAEMLRRVGGMRVIEDGDMVEVMPEARVLSVSTRVDDSRVEEVEGDAEEDEVARVTEALAAVHTRQSLQHVGALIEEGGEDMSAAAGTESPGGSPLFLASASFGGPRAGYVFTTRDQGVGYYRDVHHHGPAAV
jgi:calcium/calmodulin-dependent protein kinase I